jgi:predicted dehydrogenase
VGAGPIGAVHAQALAGHPRVFADAVADGRPPPVTGADGLRALELTFAALQSFEQGQVVKVAPG